MTFPSASARSGYRGRIAPTPTGYLHMGHAATFLNAERRAHEMGGTLILRIEDLDPQRCKAEFTSAVLEDLSWLGLRWDEGPDAGGAFGPYLQSERHAWFREVWARLLAEGFIYPCQRSRKDVAQATAAPQEGADTDEEAIFPAKWRPPPGTGREATTPVGVNWRFRVPDGERIRFVDTRVGEQIFTAGVDFGDFLVWRRDDVPAYELAVVADDHAMQISEVVRGEDLLKSTARQLLLYRALGWVAPLWWHSPLVRDSSGRRLAKRDAALSLRTLRAQGVSADALRARSRSLCLA
ncbi:MAG: tRNA glutamyl-Q(34) synthetase GluQRS [Puniceicoccales bacterium]|jgi:glutamyl-tRNA synthetase|nr:tRNA glutamyl-Q(34) synthetase GluQRS [Puniceicoccales bacterium]